MKRALLLACLALPVSVGCSSSPDPVEPSETSTPSSTGAAVDTAPPAASSAPAAEKPTTCTDDQNCVEQGALATMVGDKEKAKVLYKLGCDKQPKGKSCEKLAELEGKPVETKKEGDAKGLPGANVTIGSVTNDGMQLKDVSCIVKNGGSVGGLLGSLTVVAGLSKKKQALDACAKGQTETRVHFFQAGGKVTKVQAEASDPKVKACVEKALVGAPATAEAECVATVVHGK